MALFEIHVPGTRTWRVGVVERRLPFKESTNSEHINLQTNIRIHLTDDDPDDRLLIREAMLEADIESPLDYTVHGQGLMDYLHRQGAYAAAPEPRCLICFCST